MKKILIIFIFMVSSIYLNSQTYKKINGFSDEVNEKLKQFLVSSLTNKERKVAVFDCDGTLLGQVPYYLSEEAIFSYAKMKYDGKYDSISIEKMNYLFHILNPKDENDYVQNTLNFLSGMTVKEIEHLGTNTFDSKYKNKFYGEMKELLKNLTKFNFEIWIISASPEFLYQEIIHRELGIPKERILGMKAVISGNNLATNLLVNPYPMNQGKVEAINTFIKVPPLIVGGNSRGDMEMMNASTGLKIIVNPDDSHVENNINSGDMFGYTVKKYWEKDPNCIEFFLKDEAFNNQTFISNQYGLMPNY